MGNNYYANSKDIDLPIRTNDSITLVKQALAALENIYKEGYQYQKTGIILSGLKDSDTRVVIASATAISSYKGKTIDLSKKSQSSRPPRNVSLMR